MKTLVSGIASLLALAALADWLVVLRAHVDPVPVGALLAAVSLTLGAFVALTDAGVVQSLRNRAGKSRVTAACFPLLLLAPYLVYCAGTHTFSTSSIARLAAYLLAPSIVLLPDHRRSRPTANWRDFVAMLAVAVPVPAGWLRHIWSWPEDLYFLLPLTASCCGVYAFVVVRRLDGVGYSLLWRLADVRAAIVSWIGFTVIAIPLGYALHFIKFHAHSVSLPTLAGQFLGIYLTVAIPEELVFRGILQNLLEKSIGSRRPDVWGLVGASLVFGASHFHHPPVPNWRYCIMATVAGVFYGMVYQVRRRISSSAMTHALVDTLWHFWF